MVKKKNVIIKIKVTLNQTEAGKKLKKKGVKNIETMVNNLFDLRIKRRRKWVLFKGKLLLNSKAICNEIQLGEKLAEKQEPISKECLITCFISRNEMVIK